ncbi:MAG: hypothetical protein HUJ86_02660, partial [Synergistes sp.]|nr:hypothetical protein [Synergistes sp.]
YFKAAANADKFIPIEIDRITGAMVEVIKSSSEIDKATMSEAIDRFRNWVAMEANIETPDADNEVQLNAAKDYIRANRQYL